MKSKSTIFTDAESDAILKRRDKQYSDPTGAFARARIKLEEIERLTNTQQKRTLIKQLLTRQRGYNDAPATPMQEKAFNEFANEVGY